MLIPTKYYGTYTDEYGTTNIVIENDFQKLIIEIDGVKFIGFEFSDLAIVNKSQYSHKQLERFTLWPNSENKPEDAKECLCNCSFKFSLIQTLINKLSNTEHYYPLIIEYTLGKERPNVNGGIEFENIEVTLQLPHSELSGKGDVFEIAFDQIHKQFDDKFGFKNCYGCMFGDYSYAGQSSFGTMLCFASQKENYLKVANKHDYMKLPNIHKQVQEIFCCDEFEMRKKSVGYRG